MYCAKVIPGTEWIRVKHFPGGFLPTYKTVDAEGKSRGKAFVVPGYVFMLREPLRQRCQTVPEEEWKAIEAISDPHTTYVEAGTGKILKGPLKAVEKQITFRTMNSVQVSAELLGRRRQYWLPVRTVTEEDLAAEEAEKSMRAAEQTAEKEVGQDAEDGAGQANGKAAEETAGTAAVDGAKKDLSRTEEEPKTMSATPKYNVTEEQKAAMLARAEEIGVKNAATEFGVPWQTIAQYKRRANEQAGKTKPAEHEEAKKTGDAAKEKAEDIPAQETAIDVKAKAEADDASAKETTADTKAKADDASANEPAAAEKEKAENTPEKKAETFTPSDIEALKVENAVLQDRIKQLEDRVNKLTRAVREMISSTE